MPWFSRTKPSARLPEKVVGLGSFFAHVVLWVAQLHRNDDPAYASLLHALGGFLEGWNDLIPAKGVAQEVLVFSCERAPLALVARLEGAAIVADRVPVPVHSYAIANLRLCPSALTHVLVLQS